MWFLIAFGLVGAGGAMAAMHFGLQRRSQHRALRALRWIENSLGTAGHVSGMRWLDDCRFEVALKVVHPVFQRAYIHVNLKPWSFVKGFGRFRSIEPDSFTFHADLDLTPTFSMAFHRLRWFARTDKHLSTEAPGWQVLNCSPLALTTRTDWERDVTQAIYTVLHSEHRESLDVAFRRATPNFSLSLPLDTLSPDNAEPLPLLDLVREIAEGISLKKAS